MLEKTTRINFLLDFYQELLTPKQRNYMELYYLEDYSLGEISETFDVSRQAVYDNIRRTESMLEAYEDKLHLYKKFTARNQLLGQLEEALQESQDTTLRGLVNSLKELD
ncbi:MULTISPECIES: putative DNA-binding protein [Sediminibacillus]|uniref:putative DNA-binding protein n=1 Tax=Sediminibacillus TaxID=482460 RepID=UPI0004195F3C|nr:putative DNA-binding protein [Sediminibacillus terrae]